MLISTRVSKKYKKKQRSGSSKDRRVRYDDSSIDNADPGELLDSGIILISSSDPLSRLFTYITRQEYSLVGIYKRYDSFRYTLIDLISIFDGEEPHWSMGIRYLHEVKDLECINKIILYPYREPIDITFGKHYDTPIEDLLIHLFGYHILYLPGIDRIKMLLYPDNEHEYNDNDPIKSFIEASDMLNDKIIIDNKGKSGKNFRRDRYYLSQILSTFIDMMSNDDKFLDMVSNKYLNQVYPYDDMYQILIDQVSIQDQIIKLLVDWTHDGNIEVDKLKHLIDEIKSTNTITTDWNLSEPFQLEIPDKMIAIDKTPTPEIVQSVTSLKAHIHNISDTINRDEIPYIEFNGIIEKVNDLVNYYNIGPAIPTIDKPSTGLISISPNGDTSVPLTLKSGNKITITSRNFNLTMFTKSELIEILEMLDHIITDDRYDDLRTKITTEIATR